MSNMVKSVLILIILEYIYILLWSVAYLLKSLNPYYTGIHLHFARVSFLLKMLYCLNPYYTGIHLHCLRKNWHKRRLVLILIILEYIYICYTFFRPYQLFSLNPYYTGIHLHPKETQKENKKILS